MSQSEKTSEPVDILQVVAKQKVDEALCRSHQNQVDFVRLRESERIQRYKARARIIIFGREPFLVAVLCMPKVMRIQKSTYIFWRQLLC